MDSMMTCQLASWQRLSDPGLSKLSASSVGSKDALGTSKFGQHAAWADGWLVCSRLGVARAGMTKGEPAAAEGEKAREKPKFGTADRRPGAAQACRDGTPG
eukprot:scaffold6285_cov121-Isochrysis_galbana.AAC.8